MIYLDTNVFVYALSSNVDDIAQYADVYECERLITFDRGLKNFKNTQILK